MTREMILFPVVPGATLVLFVAERVRRGRQHERAPTASDKAAPVNSRGETGERGGSSTK